MTARPIRHASVEIGPDRFDYAEAGDGPPLIFLHGAPGDRHVWEEHVGLLSDRYRCLAYTQRWCGDAAWRADGPTFSTATHVADLAAFADKLALRPVTLVAWSYSAHVALQAIIENPGLVAQAIIFELGTASHIDNPAELAAYGADIRDMLSPLRAIEGASSSSSHPLHVLEKAPETIVTSIARDAMRGIDIPVSIWWGGSSRTTFILPSKAAASLIRRGDHGEVPGADHEWPRYHAREFCARVRDGLELLTRMRRS